MCHKCIGTTKCNGCLQNSNDVTKPKLIKTLSVDVLLVTQYIFLFEKSDQHNQRKVLNFLTCFSMDNYFEQSGVAPSRRDIYCVGDYKVTIFVRWLHDRLCSLRLHVSETRSSGETHEAAAQPHRQERQAQVRVVRVLYVQFQ